MSNETQTILCGVDGSEHSVRAAQVAHALANALEAHLVLAYVSPGGVRPLPVAPAAAYVADQDVEPDLAVLSDTAARAGLTGVRTRRVEAGSATEGLLAAARVEFPQLIVVGASGHSAVREALLGSVAGQLPSKAPCPVVVTPREAVIPEATRAPASDGSVVCGIADSSEAEPVARTAGRLAQALGHA